MAGPFFFQFYAYNIFVVAVEMRQTLIILMIVVLMESGDGQHPNCIDDCTASK